MYNIGDKVYFKNSDQTGIVIGSREVYWSGDKFRSVTYKLELSNGRIRNFSQEDLLDTRPEK